MYANVPIQSTNELNGVNILYHTMFFYIHTFVLNHVTTTCYVSIVRLEYYTDKNSAEEVKVLVRHLNPFGKNVSMATHT